MQQIIDVRDRPLFRWAGSKKQLIPKLSLFWSNSYSRYVEPFAGSASLFFSIKPVKALIGDKNEELIQAYQILSKNYAKVYNLLRRIKVTRSNYFEIRSKTCENLNAIERTVRFIFLNRFCFNGLYRTNLEGKFNVPFGSGKNKIMGWEEFRRSAMLLKNANFVCADFEETLSSIKADDFVYLDPPYVFKKRKAFKEYNKQSFTLDDLVRLGKMLKRVNAAGAKFVLSYAYCKEVKNIMNAWNCRKVLTRRHIAGFAKFRKETYEVFVTNLSFPF
ncbi:MAG: Dam family site-specific DNA-(adenine-N6)-methyltransferase [Candidatus Omnitrophota bacterium]